MIDRFIGEYRWLSNFWPVRIHFERLDYPSVEHAYQAAKFPTDRREPFTYGTAGEAKRLGRRPGKRPDWDAVKVAFMAKFLEQKFYPGTNLAHRLLETADHQLVEGNTWGDIFWGVCDGRGENQLGILLMRIRNDLAQPPYG